MTLSRYPAMPVGSDSGPRFPLQGLAVQYGQLDETCKSDTHNN
jgi:hypothetical protein